MQVTHVSQKSTKARTTSLEENDCTVPSDVGLGLSNTSWFYRLIALMFGISVVVIGDVLYNFVSSPLRSTDLNDTGLTTDNLTSRPYLHRYTKMYAIRLSIFASILIVFTVICLGIDGKRKVVPGEPLQEQAGKGLRVKKWQKVVRECLWAVGLVTLVVLIALIDWYLFLRNSRTK